jgi:dTDP-glucose pyrophosphorylase
MNILILAAGQDEIALNDAGYPFYLTEFDGIPLIERLLNQLKSIKDCNFLYAFPAKEIKQWHLDNIIEQLTPGGRLISVKQNTAGAACTALLAIEYIDNDQPLLIVNMSDLVNTNFSEVIEIFHSRNLDVGVITFHSIHPRYSYVAIDDNQNIIEAAEKNPISKNACAGFYWFARGCDFVQAASSMIAKDAHINGQFYITPVLNELILQQTKIGAHFIDNAVYHPFKTLRHIEQFDSSLKSEKIS